MERKAGILLHPSSLPGPYPIGDFGSEAYAFVDWLESAGQKLWQMLPLLPPDNVGSPYASHSAMGISQLYISLEKLLDDDLVCQRDPRHKGSYPVVDYGEAYKLKDNLLKHSYGHFLDIDNASLNNEFNDFCVKEAHWLDEYALFEALKAEFAGARWQDWPADVKKLEKAAIEKWRSKLSQEINNEKYNQWLVHRQWFKLKKYANNKGIEIIGDIPFFVRHDSVDVWAHQNKYLLDKDGQPKVVAGVPPDMFSELGQYWGNPIYDWSVVKREGYVWWLERIKYYRSLFDVLRIDHFRGYESLWQIPAKTKDARKGKWALSPGEELLSMIKEALPKNSLIAEDIGLITDKVVALRDKMEIPGVRVILFGFGDDTTNPSLPHNFPENCVGYTGTHDTDTARGWLDATSPDRRERALDYTKAGKDNFADTIIRLGMASAAHWFITPLQDVLNLDNEARMNTPNSTNGNWSWRVSKKDLTEAVAEKMKKVSRNTNRY
ncbi:MAG: 4-alpha-glucanotransferase [Patescibacteria group bacterium]